MPFKYAKAEKHMEGQHHVKWLEYKTFETDEEREQFFVNNFDAPIVNAIHAHLSPASLGDRALVFDIDACIIDDVIGEMLYNKEDEGSSDEEQADAEKAHADLDSLACEREKNRRTAKLKALSLFVRGDDDSAKVEEVEKLQKYSAKIANYKVEMFKLCVKYVACGASFRMASNIVSATTDVIPQPFLGSCDDQLVVCYVRVVTAVNLQRMANAMRRTWAFSIAVDSATHVSVSHLDLHVRVFKPQSKKIENSHLIALSMQDQHTDSVMSDLVKFIKVVALD